MPNPLDDLTGKNIIVDDVPLPDRKVLELVSGENVALEAADDSVNGRTVITVSATGVGGGGVSGSGSVGQAAAWSDTDELEGTFLPAAMWIFDEATADANPGAGKFRLNVATPLMSTSTELYISADEELGVTWGDTLATLGAGSFILIQQTGTDARYLCEVTGAVTGGSYKTIPITVVSTRGGVAFTADGLCSFSFLASASASAPAAEDVTFDDTSAGTGETDVQGAIDVLAGGKVAAVSGDPAYASGYSVARPRTEDGAFVTVLSADRLGAKYKPDPVTHAAASSAEIGSFFIDDSRSAVLACVIKAHETGTLANGAELFFRVVVSTDGSGNVTLSTTRSTCGTNSSVTGGVPDALPVTLPGWISSYATLITIGTGTANRVKFNVAQASTTSVKWALVVDAEVVA